MSAPTQPSSSTTSPTVAEIDNSVASELSTADSIATQAVQLTSNINTARLAQRTRAAASITARFGASSPQAVAAEAAVTASKATVARVAIISQQVSVATPQVSATGWALYGHVYNAQLHPVPAYTVFLVDAKKAYQSAYGFCYTDSTGYFLISFAGDPQIGSKSGPAGFSTGCGGVSNTASTLHRDRQRKRPAGLSEYDGLSTHVRHGNLSEYYAARRGAADRRPASGNPPDRASPCREEPVTKNSLAS